MSGTLTFLEDSRRPSSPLLTAIIKHPCAVTVFLTCSAIRGDPGVTRTHIMPANELVETLLTRILLHDKFGRDRRVAVMVYNRGQPEAHTSSLRYRRDIQFLGVQIEHPERFDIKISFWAVRLLLTGLAGIANSVAACAANCIVPGVECLRGPVHFCGPVRRGSLEFEKRHSGSGIACHRTFCSGPANRDC
jgi:hypothetical protein